MDAVKSEIISFDSFLRTCRWSYYPKIDFTVLEPPLPVVILQMLNCLLQRCSTIIFFFFCVHRTSLEQIWRVGLLQSKLRWRPTISKKSMLVRNSENQWMPRIRYKYHGRFDRTISISPVDTILDIFILITRNTI